LYDTEVTEAAKDNALKAAIVTTRGSRAELSGSVAAKADLVTPATPPINPVTAPVIPAYLAFFESDAEAKALVIFDSAKESFAEKSPTPAETRLRADIATISQGSQSCSAARPVGSLKFTGSP
jgi:hypothetical protein